MTLKPAQTREGASHVDQTRFTTEDTAWAVMRALLLKPELWPSHGGAMFPLTLQVPITYSDEVVDGAITLIVDRIAPENIRAQTVLTHPDGSSVLETVARVEPNGEPFKISATLPAGTSHIEGAQVIVSRDMEAIILRYLERHDRSA